MCTDKQFESIYFIFKCVFLVLIHITEPSLNFFFFLFVFFLFTVNHFNTFSIMLGTHVTISQCKYFVNLTFLQRGQV